MRSPSSNRGYGKCRVLNAPAASCALGRSSMRTSIHGGGTGNIRHSPRNGFTVYGRSLRRGVAVSRTVISRERSSNGRRGGDEAAISRLLSGSPSAVPAQRIGPSGVSPLSPLTEASSTNFRQSPGLSTQLHRQVTLPSYFAATTRHTARVSRSYWLGCLRTVAQRRNRRRCSAGSIDA